MLTTCTTTPKIIIPQTLEMHSNQEASANREMCSPSRLYLGESHLPVCRICYSANNLISPCNCKGTVGTVHLQCLERWLNESQSNYCDLCSYCFDTDTKLRFSCFESIRIWAKNPQTGFLFRFDVLIFVVITLCTITMLTMVGFRLHQFNDLDILVGNELDELQWWDTRYWIMLLYILFATAVVVIFIGNMKFFYDTQIRPWYRWWRNARRISIILLNEQISSA